MALRPQHDLASELEKLDQQITLTLQEIDRNFARAHRIVTTSILPIVERYAKESEAVWEGSKFWKSFFEASANVALSHQVEEPSYTEAETTEQQTTQYEDEETVDSHHHREHPGDDTTHIPSSPAHYSQDHRHQQTHGKDDELLDDSLLESLHLGHTGPQSTPRRAPRASATAQKPKWANIDSPFSVVERELTSRPQRPSAIDFHDESTSSSSHHPPPSSHVLPPDDYDVDMDIDDDDEDDNDPALGDDATRALPPAPQTPRSVRRPGRRNRYDSDSDDYSPPMPDITTNLGKTPQTGRKGPILHKVLDTKWRLQATPLGKPAPSRYATVDKTRTPARGRLDFGAPNTGVYNRTVSSSPPMPEMGTMVFTPKAQRAAASAFSAANRSGRNTGKEAENATIGWDSDDSDELILPPGFSPPKTMQFSIAPSKLIATPARQASQMIVRDIMQTAGASYDDESTTQLEAEESMRRRAVRVERRIVGEESMASEEFSSPVRGGDMMDDDPF